MGRHRHIGWPAWATADTVAIAILPPPRTGPARWSTRLVRRYVVERLCHG
jgi:hypothetical protein